jgi:hypothetical protein
MVGARGAALLRREGDYWTLAHDGQVLRLRHLKGLDYLAHLLREPGRGVPVAELAALRCYRRRDRPYATAAAERRRVAVTKAIRSAVRRIASYDRALGAIFQASIQTGATCSYRPVPGGPSSWQL